jgi:plastocyanin
MRRRPRLITIGVLAAAALGAADPGATDGTGRTEEAVEVRLFAFAPAELTVPAGTRLTWTNADATEHTVAWGTPEQPDRRLRGGTLAGQGASHVEELRAAGTYRYHCARHRFMRGTITVTATGDHL